MPKISIVMPVYNGSRWLEESITSVLEQTYNDYELICVNDSSVDNSEEIIKNYSKKDNRIKLFTKQNEGPGMALNYGISVAEGEYLCFIDQDDKYKNNYLEKMLYLIERTGCNLCECNGYFWEGEKLTRIPYPKVKFNDNIADIRTHSQKRPFSGCYFPQWTKIIKKSFWDKNDIKFPDRINKAHDVPVHYKLIGLCDKIGYTDECLYFHRYHNEQISYNFDSGLYNCLSVKDVFEWLKRNNISFSRKNIFKRYLKYLIQISYKAANSVEVFDELLKILKENYFWFERFNLCRKIKKKKRKFIKEQQKILNLPKINCKHVGKNSYCASQPFIANPNGTTIGSFVSVGENVRIGHGEHPLSFLSTSPYFYYDNLGWKTNTTPSHNEFWDYEPIHIGNDVWIGDNVLIKNGITIGDGAILGMGAVVTRDVPPYAIVVGIPAKVIKYRFNDQIIKCLMESKWWELDDDALRKLPYDDINKTIECLKEKRV